MTYTFTPVDQDTARSLIGEGIHTGLRKGCNDGHEAWTAINDMPDEDWSSALRFLVDGLESMGYVLCERRDTWGG